MIWDLEGMEVTGMYLGLWPFSGRVVNSRVKFGGAVQHTVTVDQPICAYGEQLEQLLVSIDDLYRIIPADELS
jgi:hypothetical protein